MEDLKVLEQQMRQEKPVKPIPALPVTEAPALEQPKELQPDAPMVPEERDPVMVGITPADLTGIEAQLTTLAADQKHVREIVNQLADRKIEAPTAAGVDPAVAAKLDSVEKTMAELRDKNMSALRQMMDFIQGNGRQMNAELEKYHKMYANSAHDSIWRELGSIYHAILRVMEQHPDKSLQDDLAWDVLEPMEELMEGYGVAVLQSRENTRRSIKSTHSVKQIPTADPDKNGFVARSVRPGFARDGIVLVREEVESYVFDQDLKDAEDRATAEKLTADTVPEPSSADSRCSAEPAPEETEEIPAPVEDPEVINGPGATEAQAEE